MEKFNIRFVLYLALSAAIGGFLYGFDVAIIAGAMPFFESHFELSSIQLGVVNSSLLFGCIIGTVFTGQTTDKWGRKSMMIMVAVLFFFTSLGCALAPKIEVLIIARFIGGVAVGAISVLSPMYIAEISPAKQRGKMVTLYQLSITFGILVSLLVNYMLKNSPHNWRWMFATGTVPAFVFLVVLFFIPESPRYLAGKGKFIQAAAILRKIGGEVYSATTIEHIKDSLYTKKTSVKELFKPGLRRPLLISIVLAILIQASGIAAIIDYAPRIFQSAGLGIETALLNTFGIGIANFLFTFISVFTVDKFGRKPLYLIGSIGMALSLIYLSVSSITGHFNGVGVMISCISFIFFFASFIGPVFWTLMPEFFPNNVRGQAMSVPIFTQWLINGLVVMLFPVMMDNMISFTFAFLATMSVIQFVFTWIFVPETKGRTLEEIDSFWKKK